jgi:hypothetical protein
MNPAAAAAAGAAAVATQDALAAVARARRAHDRAALLRLLAAHAADAAVLEAAATALCATWPEQQPRGGGRSAAASPLPEATALVDASLAALRAHADDSRALCYVLLLLDTSEFWSWTGVSQGARLARALDAGGAIELLLDAMRRHAANWDVQDYACKILARLLTSRAARERALRADALQLVVGALRRHGCAREFGSLLLRALAELLQRPTPATQAAARAAGAAAAAVRAMREQLEDECCQMDGCFVLAHGLVTGVEAPLPAREAADASEAVLAAMAAHAASRAVQLNCCNTLACLWPAAQPRARCEAAARAVQRAMTAFPRVADVQTSGCNAMVHIFSNAPRRAASAAAHDAAAAAADEERYDAGACIAAVLAAMRAHHAQSELQMRGTHALVTLLADAPPLTHDIQCEALETALAVTQVHPQLQRTIPHLNAFMDAHGLPRIPSPPPQEAAAAEAEQQQPGHEGCACPGCSVVRSSGVRLLRCKGCRAAAYCGVVCQRKDWRAHKPACRAAQEAEARERAGGGMAMR